MSGWEKRLEKAVLRGAALLAILLVLVQAAMTDEDVRYRLSIGEQFEGRPVALQTMEAIQAASDSALTGEETISPWAELEIEALKFSSLPRAQVLVNGDKAGDFSVPRLRLRVMADDDVEIVTSSYNFPIQFKLVRVSSNVAQPQAGQIFTSDSGRVFLGKIMVK